MGISDWSDEGKHKVRFQKGKEPSSSEEEDDEEMIDMPVRRSDFESDRHTNGGVINYRQLNGDDVSLSSSESSSEDTADTLSKASSSDDDNNDVLYENKTFVTCRSPSDSFYLCQVLQDVYTNTKKIRIRWCSIVGDNGDDTKIGINTRFKLDYRDTLDPDTILTSISDVIYHDDNNTISLKKEDIVETKRLLQKSICDESLSSDDMMDLSTEHNVKKKLPSHIHFESSSEDESSSSSASQSSTTISTANKKRKRASNKQKSRKQPARKRARKTSDTSGDAV
ncbi:unnamed protein product, partial [Rotaria sp. Silwood1]